jgi:ankyrin repeat protein
MLIRPLPNDPSFEHLRKEAKRLRKAVRLGDTAALAQVKEFHPRPNESTTLFSLSDAQLVTARTYGFTSWTKLKQYLIAIEPFVWNPPQPSDDSGPLVDVFIKLACLNYGAWHRSNPAKARRLLTEHPELAQANISSAAAAGDVSAARAMIERDPASVKAKAGPLRWEPLLYACYSRMDGTAPNRSTLEVARLLLAHGADPNAGFLWGGTYVFTALTGAFGEGEDGINQPPHPHRDALARLLLDAGADPNDGQTLYNRHFRVDDDHLKLLVSYGLGHDKGGPWFKRLGDRTQNPARLLVEELWSAARNNFPQRVKLLVDHGVDVNTPGLRNGRTPYEEALRAGNHAVAEYLLEHGAKKVELDRNETFALACITGRRAEALAQLADDPTMLEKLGHRGRVDLIHRAVDAGRPDGVRLIVELGVDVNGMVPNSGLDRSPLHSATIGGNLEMVKLLLDLGADPGLCDPTYHSTPIGWAYHGQQQHVVDYLLRFATIFDALRCDGVERVAALLEQDPSLANAADDGGNPLVFYLHPEMTRLEQMVQLLTAYGADLNARNREGKTLLDRALARGWTDFATVLRAHGARPATDSNSAS